MIDDQEVTLIDFITGFYLLHFDCTIDIWYKSLPLDSFRKEIFMQQELLYSVIAFIIIIIEDWHVA